LTIRKGGFVMQEFYIIGYRLPGNATIFYRGDFRPRIRLGPINPLSKGGWVSDITAARLFVHYPVFTGDKCIHHTLDGNRIAVYPYREEITWNQIILPNR